MFYLYELLATTSLRSRLGNPVMELKALRVILDVVESLTSLKRTRSDTGFTASIPLYCGECRKMCGSMSKKLQSHIIIHNTTRS